MIKYTSDIKAKSYCSACGNETRFHSILICAECIDDECNKFGSMFEEDDRQDDAIDFVETKSTNISEFDHE